jgi:hypothetical protein
MGGDHKCPVCEATFTRPQHVARHMRSRPSPSSLLHFTPLTFFQTRVIDLTNVNSVEINLLGGPPFCITLLHSPNLCLSDLLSRHVNKCHANEKPVPSTGVRKKGSVSASRATTSKQVCDQCVQANSSCDGCNPCGKFSILLFFIFLYLSIRIQQNAFIVDIDALLLNSTVKPHHWVQVIQPVPRELNLPSRIHQVLTL